MKEKWIRTINCLYFKNTKGNQRADAVYLNEVIYFYFVTPLYGSSFAGSNQHQNRGVGKVSRSTDLEAHFTPGEGGQIKLQAQVSLPEQWALNKPLFEVPNLGLDANMASPA